jgi:hypothetical protein
MTDLMAFIKDNIYIYIYIYSVKVHVIKFFDLKTYV